MTILETFIRLRDDLKAWVTNNLNQKANISYVDEKFDANAKNVEDALNLKLDSDELLESIDTALSKAKESGEFDGKDGYTPVKGTDYYTDADKIQIVNDVLAALPTWTGGSY